MSPESHRKQALALVTAAAIGWFTSCAREAASSPSGGHAVDVCDPPRLTQRFGAPVLGRGGDQRAGQNDKRNGAHHQRQIGLIEKIASPWPWGIGPA